MRSICAQISTVFNHKIVATIQLTRAILGSRSHNRRPVTKHARILTGNQTVSVRMFRASL
jgi:hypothetical protein